MKPNELIMTFDSRSAAFQPVDLVVNQAGVPDRTAFMRGTSTAPQQRCWTLLPGFCSPRSQQGLTRRRGPRGLPSEPAWTVARVQPTANQFAPPDQPNVSASDARTVDQLIGPRPATRFGSRFGTPHLGGAER
jgi:hypothetical protein